MVQREFVGATVVMRRAVANATAMRRLLVMPSEARFVSPDQQDRDHDVDSGEQRCGITRNRGTGPNLNPPITGFLNTTVRQRAADEPAGCNCPSAELVQSLVGRAGLEPAT
jgi:hypothetical protein